MDGPTVAIAVVGAQVACISRGLVDVGLRRNLFALEFEHDDRAADQQQHVGPPKLQRKLVLENRAVLRGIGVRVQRLADLALQPGDAVVPRPHLRRIDIGQEILQPSSHHARLGRVKHGKGRAPAVACFGHESLPASCGHVAR